VLVDDILAEKERSTRQCLVKEVRRSSCKPLEDGETGATLEDKQSNGLLDEEPNNDSTPSNIVSIQ
jgi:hypothetical protein